MQLDLDFFSFSFNVTNHHLMNSLLDLYMYVFDYCIFQTTRHPQIWEENEGVSYSPNVAYLVLWEKSC